MKKPGTDESALLGGHTWSDAGPPGPPALGEAHLGEPRFEVTGVIGLGGMGRVLRVRDHLLGRDLARKELHDARAGTATRERFVREARITAALEHPGVVPVHDFGDDGAPWFTMKEVKGRTLAEAIADAAPAGGGAPIDALIEALVRVCETVAFAHARGVVHRDLKPANIMLGGFGETLVLDWGLARSSGGAGALSMEAEDAEAPAALTVAGRVMGTPAYMSPEQALGDMDRVDARSDVWSLGVVLWEILSGRRLFDGNSSAEVLAAVRNGVGRRLDAVPPRAPVELWAVARRATALTPADRYPDAGALAEDIRAWQAGRRVSAHAYSPREVGERWVRRHLAAVATATLLLTLGAALGAVAVVRIRTERDRAVDAEARRAAGEVQARSDLQGYLVQQAREAELDRMPAAAAIFGARALTIGEEADARGAVLAASNAWVPELLWRVRPEVQCDRPALAPDGRLVACATSHGVDVWAPDRAIHARWETNHSIGDVAFDASSRRLALAPWAHDEGGGPVIRILDPWTGAELARRTGSQRYVHRLLWAPDGGLAVSGLRTLYQRWDADGRLTATGPPEAEATGALALAPDGTLATAVSAFHIYRYSSTGYELPMFQNPHGRQDARALAFSPSGALLAAAAGDLDARIEVFDTAANRKRRDLGGARGGVFTLAFAGSDERLIAGGDDGSLTLWNPLLGVPLARVDIADSGVLDARWAPGGRLLTVVDDGALALWGVGDAAAEVLDHAAALGGIAYSPDGARVAACHSDGARAEFAAATGAVLGSSGATNRPCAGVAYDGQGRLLRLEAGRGLVSSDRGVIYAEPDGADPLGIRVAPDGREVAVLYDGDPQGRLVLADGTGAGRELPAHVTSDSRIAWSPASDRIAITDGKGEDLEIYDVATRSRVRTLAVGSDAEAMAWGPGGIIVAGYDAFLYRVDPEGGPVSRFGGGDERVSSVSLSPDGRLLAAEGSAPGVTDGVSLWDVASGTLRARMYAGHGNVDFLAFSPDGRRVASGHADGTVRTWDLADLETPGGELLDRWLHRLGLRFDGARLAADPDWRAGGGDTP